MEKRRTTLDRKPLKTEYIRGKQDFNTVLKGYKAVKPPLWKSAWFYGPVGLATLAIILTITNLKEDKAEYEAINTRVELSAFNNQPSENQQQNSEAVDKSNLDFEVEKESMGKVERPKEKAIVAIKNDDANIPGKRGEELEKSILSEQEENASDKVEKVVATGKQNTGAIRRPVPVYKADDPKFYRNTMPRISGIGHGSIKTYDLCTASGITCNDGSQVISFKVQYYDGDNDVIEAFRGNQISPDLCYRLKRYNVNMPVVFREIVVVDPSGTKKMVPHLSLIPIQ